MLKKAKEVCVNNCEVSEILLCLQANVSLPQYHGCWRKTQDSWVRGVRQYSLQQKQEPESQHVCICALSPRFPQEQQGWSTRMLAHAVAPVKRKEYWAQEPSVLWQPVSKLAKNEALPHPTRSGLNKEHLLFILYCDFTVLPFSAKQVAAGNTPEGMSPNNL